MILIIFISINIFFNYSDFIQHKMVYQNEIWRVIYSFQIIKFFIDPQEARYKLNFHLQYHNHCSHY
jgi:hypothetical protein